MTQRHVWLTAAVIGLPVLSLVYQITKLTSDRTSCSNKRAYIHALARRASPDRYIVLALVDAAFVDMAINLYEMTFRPNGVDNFLFVGVGRRVCELMNASSALPCYHYADDMAANEPSVYMSRDFIRKMNIRTRMIVEALNAGFSVLHTDLDIVFFRNPLPHLKEVMLSADIATLWDQSAYNAGFVVVRPTWYGRRVYELMRQRTTTSKTVDDQTALNEAIRHLWHRYRRKGFTAAKLDVRRYLCGVEYFESSADRWSLASDEVVQPGCRNDAASCPVVVHNNWIVSREAKIYRFKEHLMWMYDKDGYFSSPTTDYITYENPLGAWTTEKATIDAQLKGLRTALAIAIILDRVLILPRFHCFSESTRSHVECPLNSLLAMTPFDAGFAGRYRESSFLRHPLVPEVVRCNVSTTYLIAAKPVADTHHVNVTVVVRQHSTNLTTADELVQLLGTDRHRVVSLASLERVRVTFKSAAQQKHFDDAVSSSFKRSDYRQLAKL